MNRLRTKFILLSTASLLFLLAIIVISGGILNYREMTVNADAVLEMLASGQVRMEKEISPNKPAQRQKKIKNMSIFGEKSLSPETKYESRFFTIVLSKEDMIREINTENILMIDKKQAYEYAKAVTDKKNMSGFISTYRYLKVDKENDDTFIIFLDCGRSIDSFRSFIAINCLISMLGFFVSMIIIIIFSKKIVKPVYESYDKQKQFISMAGHELKTPLTIIDADAEVLSMEFEEENEWLCDICRQTKKMAVLTNDLLSLSRMDEKKHTPVMIEFPISDVVSETLHSFQTLAHQKGKYIAAELTPMLSCTGDEKGIRQICGILLDNAIKYSKSDEVRVKLFKKGHNIILSVENESEVINQEQLKRLFERFYRTEESRNSENGGYGLGLAIAKAIAEAHKGKITATAPDDGHLQITVTLHC